jgi:hypothetical protein
MSVSSGVSGCGNPYLININTGSDGKENDREKLKMIAKENLKKRIKEQGREKVLEDHLKKRAEKKLTKGKPEEWHDRNKYPALQEYFQNVLKMEKEVFELEKKSVQTKQK